MKVIQVARAVPLTVPSKRPAKARKGLAPSALVAALVGLCSAGMTVTVSACPAGQQAIILFNGKPSCGLNSPFGAAVPRPNLFRGTVSPNHNVWGGPATGSASICLNSTQNSNFCKPGGHNGM